MPREIRTLMRSAVIGHAAGACRTCTWAHVGEQPQAGRDESQSIIAVMRQTMQVNTSLTRGAGCMGTRGCPSSY